MNMKQRAWSIGQRVFILIIKSSSIIEIAHCHIFKS
jgi:hypothetical protein